MRDATGGSDDCELVTQMQTRHRWSLRTHVNENAYRGWKCNRLMLDDSPPSHHTLIMIDV